MTKIADYFNLFRLDVAIISFLSYLLGAQLAGGLDFKNFVIGLFVSLASVNFIYSLNSWADREIDKINKPSRPIPSGKIKPGAALVYCIALLAVSLAYPFFVCKSIRAVVLFLLFPLVGIIYSVKPFWLKRNFIASGFLTSITLVLPVALGCFVNAKGFYPLPLFAALFFYSLSIVPLKDIEDMRGDVACGCGNWFFKLGRRKLLLFSLSGLIFDLFFVAITGLQFVLKELLYFFIGSSIAIIIFFSRASAIGRLYKAIIRAVIIETAVFLAFLRFGAGFIR